MNLFAGIWLIMLEKLPVKKATKKMGRLGESEILKLIQKAEKCGATAAAAISAGDISVEPELALFCTQKKCEGYGKSMHCPPFGMNPSAFKKLLSEFSDAVVFKIDASTKKLLGEEKAAEFMKLQTISAQLESFARREGFRRARAFAGGSCKEIFCSDRPCSGLSDSKSCRYEEIARASMSGLGINVFKLVEKAGWEMRKVTGEGDSEAEPVGTLAGLVLIC